MDQSLKKTVNVLAIPLILSLIVLALAASWKLFQSSFQPGATPSLSVAGEGKVTVKPDIAEVGFAVVEQGNNPTLLQALNDKKMASVLDYLKTQGVREDDIKTTGYLLQPQYATDKEPPRIIGYTLTQTVNAKIRDLGSVGKIVGGLTEKGVNQINAVSFSVENPEPYKAEAREEAIRKAQAQAKASAKSLGVRLGRVLTYYEAPVFVPVPFAVGGFEGKGGDFVRAPIQPGTQEITLSVNITYAIR